jgi:outer membrane receptor protein involved in Fe transport
MKLIRAVVAGCLIGSAASARAQEPVQQAAPEPYPHTYPDTIPVQVPTQKEELSRHADSSVAELEAIVVTGEKLGRTQEQTATSVSITSGRQIEDYGDESLYDLMRRTANVSADGVDGFSIRGISDEGAEGLSRGTPVISVYLDGVALDPTAQGGNAVDSFDLEQVEILRGPQSTSQGRNALAGAVVATTRDPTDWWDALARVRVAERGTRQYAAAGGGPLGAGFAFRLAGDFSESDGDIVNVTRNDPEWAASKDELLRAKLAYKPAWAPDFSTLLTLSDTRAEGGNYGQLESDEDGARRRSTDNEPRVNDTRTRLASLRAEYAFVPAVVLSSITGYSRSELDRLNDVDQTEGDGGARMLLQDGRNLTQELRLNLKGWGPLTGLIGLFASSFETGFDSSFHDLAIPLSAVLPLPGTENVVARVDGRSVSDQDGRNLALFAEFDWRIVERLTLTAGLRYDRERRNLITDYVITRADYYPLGNESLPPLNLLPVLQAAGVLPGTDGAESADGDYGALLPKLGLRYALAPRYTAFVTYAEAYRAGGAEVSACDSTLNSYDPEYTRNWETGLRTQPLPRLDVNLNVYRVDWRDQQVLVPSDDGLCSTTQNAARSTLHGGELESAWRPLSSLRLYASLGVSRTEFKDYRTADADFTGNEFVQAPHFTGSLGGSWRSARGAFASASFSRGDGYWSTPDNDDRERGDARDLLDARLGWEFRAVKAYLYGRNLLDEDYVRNRQRVTTGLGLLEEGTIVTYGDRRLLGVQIEVRLP